MATECYLGFLRPKGTVAYNLYVCNVKCSTRGATKPRALVKRLQGSMLAEDTLVDEEWFVIPWVLVPTAPPGLTNPNCSSSFRSADNEPANRAVVALLH